MIKDTANKLICFLPLNGGAPWGGSELLWSQLASLWHAQDMRIKVGIQNWHPMPSQILNLEQINIELKRYKYYPSLTRRILKKLSASWNQSPSIHPLHGWIKAIKPDLLVVSGDCMTGLAGVRLAADLGIPYAYIMQANSESMWPSDAQRQSMLSCLRTAQGNIFFVSEKNKELFELQLGESLCNAHLIWNPHAAIGLDPLAWPRAPVQTNNASETADLRLAFVGRLEPNSKGQDLLFRALASPGWRNRSWSLTLYGSGDCEGSVKSMAKLLGINKSLNFISAYQSIEQVWTNAHALVMASRYEGLPLALAEAMWLGRPAVVTDSGDSALLVRDNIDGFVAFAPTADAVSSALEELWQNRHRLPEMGLSAAQRVRGYFPSDIIKASSDIILHRSGIFHGSTSEQLTKPLLR